MFDDWDHRSVLTPPDAFPGSGWLGLAGHSYGAAACAEIIANGDLPVRAVVSIAGTWMRDRTRQALINTHIPKLFITGSRDDAIFTRDLLPYDEARPAKHHAVIQGTDHWGWFPEGGASIFPCPGETQNSCAESWRAASELTLVFFYKYLYGKSFLRPYLLTRSGGRPPLESFWRANGCALKVRWDTTVDGVGEISHGEWTEVAPW